MIETSNVSKTYKTGDRAIKGVSLTTNGDEFVFIVGKNDFDKGTLMKLLLKGLEPTKRHIMINDMDLGRMPGRYVPKYRRRLDMVFQNFRFLKDRTMFEDVTFARRVIEVPARVIREIVPEILRPVGLSSKYKAYPRQLSGGEQQRVTIARALINDPEMLLTDEPIGNLDSFNTHGIMRLLEEINQRGTAVVVVTHSQEMMDEVNKRTITMERGLVVSDMGGYCWGAAPGALESLWACFFRRKGK